MAQQSTIALDFALSGVERLTVEVQYTNSEHLKVIGNYLLKVFAKDTILEKAYAERKITLSDIGKYVNEQARKRAIDGCACIEDDEVFGWAVHYVQDEEVEVKETSFQEIKVQDNEEESTTSTTKSNKGKTAKKKKDKLSEFKELSEQIWLF